MMQVDFVGGDAGAQASIQKQFTNGNFKTNSKLQLSLAKFSNLFTRAEIVTNS